MALVKCKECGHEVSDAASSCPKCAAPRKPKKNTSLFTWLVLVVLVAWVYNAATNPAPSGSSRSQPAPETTTRATQPAKSNEQLQKEARQKRIESQFSAYNGAHRNLQRVIKKAMNDPDSYEHDETVYWDRGDHLIVRTSFRGKNAFGGVVRNSVKAKVGLDGQVLEIIEQQ